MTIREHLAGYDDDAMRRFAEDVGVTLDAVKMWVSGKRRPRKEAAEVIERITHGRVSFREACMGSEQ